MVYIYLYIDFFFNKHCQIWGVRTSTEYIGQEQEKGGWDYKSLFSQSLLKCTGHFYVVWCAKLEMHVEFFFFQFFFYVHHWL